MDAPVCHHPVMEMTLRVEIFPDDLDATADFCTKILGFTVTKDERAGPTAYVSLAEAKSGSQRPGEPFRTCARGGCPFRRRVRARG
jgi:catechol 2,3-dioxygenase-like lactoylglutathione lyase family enzyme